MAEAPRNDNGLTDDIPAYRPNGVIHWHTTSAYSVPQSTLSDSRSDAATGAFSRGPSAMSIPRSTLSGTRNDAAAGVFSRGPSTMSVPRPVGSEAPAEKQETYLNYTPSSMVLQPPAEPAFLADAKPEDRRESELSNASTLEGKPSDDEKVRSDIEKDLDITAGAYAGDIEKQSQKPAKEGSDDDEEENDPNVVDWDGEDDKQNPMNWPATKKWTIAVWMGLMTLVVTFASSVFSAATMVTAQQFGVSSEVMILAVSLFVLGFAFGPVVWGPLSELYGRKIPLFAGYTCFAIFLVPVAVAQNIETIMICRFFGGFFASAPLGVVGGALADFFDPVDRGIAMSIFCSATFIGPTLGPILGGFITMSHLGWRWTQWINLIMAGLFGGIGLFIIPETYAPVILQRKAKKLKYETKNWALRAPADEKQIDFKEIAEKYLLRPFIMLALEPILVLITLYMSLIYGIIYGFFEVFPVSFQEERGWNLGVGALPFLSVLVGVVIGAIIICIITKTRFQRKLKEEGLIPEERLIPMIIGGPLLAGGLFWFAWTSSPNITPWPQIISCIPIGAGIIMIFLQGLNYIIDVYKMNANSAIAANTFFRSWVGAGFPLFATPMFHNLGVPWAMSLLGFLCVALAPVPVLYFIYGAKIRKLSKYSPD